MKTQQILIVEDDRDIRELTRDLLEMEGYQVEEAENGAEALKKLSLMSEPCLIVSDLMMPVMDGFEFLKRKNEDLRFAEFPTIILSAMHDASDHIRKCHYKNTYFMSKPADVDVLLSAVGRCCS